MMLLGTKDKSVVAYLDGTIGSKYTHHDIQNELLNITSRHVLLSKLEAIRKNNVFSIMADECTDTFNKEQFSFCIRTVDDNLEVKEDFLGYYELKAIKSVAVVNAIKDILPRFNLSLQHCRGQTYYGVSNMVGKKSKVTTKLLVEQPKALVTH